MPFTSVLGSSSVIKPGVCTSTTRPTAPYVGQLVFETDTNRVAAYTASGWVYGSFTGGLVLVKSQTIGTAVSSVTVTGAFSTDYPNYRVVVSNCTPSTTLSINITLGSAATNYSWSGYYVDPATSTLNANSSNGTTSWQSFMPGTTAGLSGFFDLIDPFLSRPTKIFAANARDGLTVDYQGLLKDTTSYTAFTLTTTTGTLTGGTIRVYGYANS